MVVAVVPHGARDLLVGVKLCVVFLHRGSFLIVKGRKILEENKGRREGLLCSHESMNRNLLPLILTLENYPSVPPWIFSAPTIR